MLIPLIRSLLLGALTGWLAGKIMNDGGRGFWKNWLLGFIGSGVGGFLAEHFHISGGRITEFLISVAGACIVLWVVHLFSKK